MAIKQYRKLQVEIDHAVDADIKYRLENNVMVDYLICTSPQRML